MNDRRYIRTLLAIVALASCVQSASYAATRIAVIAGQGARRTKLDVAAALEVYLTRENDVQLVERARMSEILEEHELVASSVVDLTTAISVGKLLAADALVIVEGLSGSTSDACRIHVVDTRSGVTLATVLGAERWFIMSSSYVLSAVRTAIEKRETPERDRRYVAVLGFRSEEPGSALDAYAAALGELLASDLGASKSVVLLDREHLEHITRERKITGLATRMKASARLIDASLKRVEGGRMVRVVARLRSLGRGRPQEVTVTVPKGNLASARAFLLKGIVEELKADAPEVGEFDIAKEAEVFAERARILTAHDEHDAACRAAETAVALSGSQDARFVAAKAYKDKAYEMRRDACGGFEAEAKLAKLPVETKERILAAHLRERTLMYDLCLEHDRLVKRGDAADLRLPWVMGNESPMRFDLLGGSATCARLVREIISVERERWRFTLDYCERHIGAKGMGFRWYTAATRFLYSLPMFSADVREWSEEFRALFVRYEAVMPKLHPAHQQGLLGSTGLYMSFGAACRKRFASRSDRRAVVEALDWVGTRADPLVRMSALVAKVAFSESKDVAAARAALALFLEEMPIDHPARVLDDDYGAVNYLYGAALKAVPDREEKIRYLRAAIDPLVKARDVRKLVSWRSKVDLLVYYLRISGRKEEAVRAATDVLDVLGDGYEGGAHGDEAAEQMRKLEERIMKLGGTVPAGGGGGGSWDAISFERIPIGRRPTRNADLRMRRVHDGRLILAWSDDVNATVMKIIVTSIPLRGGKQQKVGEANLAKGGRKTRDEITCLAADGRAVYVGTAGNGLVMFSRGRASAVTQRSGLPSNAVRTIACCAGKVYLSFGTGHHSAVSRGALVEYDPKRRKCHTIASSRSRSARNPLDGGRPYAINAIVPDAKRACLWLGVTAPKTPWERHGVYKMDLASRDIELVWKTPHFLDIVKMRLRSGTLLARSGAAAQLVGFDPDTNEKTWFAGLKELSLEKECGGPAEYGYPGVELWPCAFVGGHLITGTQRLYMHVGPDEAPLPLDRFPSGGPAVGIELMHEESDRVIIMTNSVEFQIARQR